MLLVKVGLVVYKVSDLPVRLSDEQWKSLLDMSFVEEVSLMTAKMLLRRVDDLKSFRGSIKWKDVVEQVEMCAVRVGIFSDFEE